MCSWTLDWVEYFGSMSLGAVKCPGLFRGYGIIEGFGQFEIHICNLHVVEGFVILMQSVSSPADIPRRSLMATAT